ncbi:MAG: VOC family protein [Candidatus Brocadiia bacterium]
MNAFFKLLSSALVVGCLGACAATRGEPPRVDHIRLEVSNMPASVVFYRDMVGLRERSVTKEFSVLEAANIGIFLSAKPWGWLTPRAADERPGWGMYPHFEVDNVRQLAARLKAHGYTIVQEPQQHSFGTEAFVADPDGYVWALVGPR